MKNPKTITLTLTALTILTLICIPATQVQAAIGPIAKYELTFLQTTQTQAMANTLIITAKDADSNTVPYTGSVTLTSSDAKAIHPTGNIVITNGIGSGTFYFGTSGPQTITVIDASNNQIVGTTMTDVAPIHFDLSTSATTVTAGQTVNITITAHDSQNQVLTNLGNQGYGATIIFTSTDAAAILPDADLNNRLINGTGTFAVTLNTPGSQTITVTNKAFNLITATTTAITVNPTITPTEPPTPTATPSSTETATPSATPSPTSQPQTATATPTSQPQADSQPTTPPTSNTPIDTLTIAAIAAAVIVIVVLALFMLVKSGKLGTKHTAATAK